MIQKQLAQQQGESRQEVVDFYNWYGQPQQKYRYRKMQSKETNVQSSKCAGSNKTFSFAGCNSKVASTNERSDGSTNARYTAKSPQMRSNKLDSTLQANGSASHRSLSSSAHLGLSQQSSSAARKQKRINRVVMHLQHNYDVFALNMQGLNGTEQEFKAKQIKRTLADPKIIRNQDDMKDCFYCAQNFKNNHQKQQNLKSQREKKFVQFRRDQTGFLQEKYYHGQPFTDTLEEIRKKKIKDKDKENK